MSLDQAKKLGVDVDLLRAIRVRLKLPADPRRARSTLGKPITRFDSRHRQRRLQTVPKAKRLPLAPAQPTRQDRSSDVNHQQSLVGIAPTPEKTGTAKILGNVENLNSLFRNDWKIINEIARSKLRALDRKVYPNWKGRVFHLTTRVEYTREDLMKQFGLTRAEAESCFLTL